MPGAWYSRLVAYKSTTTRDWLSLAALCYLFINRHRDRIESILGGPWSFVAVVPSTRGRSYEQQPLRRALCLSPFFQSRLRDVVAHRTGQRVDRRQSHPDAFQITDRAAVRGSRVLLIEDTWATGCKALSAAGALLSAGAFNVVLMPMARIYSIEFWTEHTPYWQMMQKRFDVEVWPRDD